MRKGRRERGRAARVPVAALAIAVAVTRMPHRADGQDAAAAIPIPNASFEAPELEAGELGSPAGFYADPAVQVYRPAGDDLARNFPNQSLPDGRQVLGPSDPTQGVGYTPGVGTLGDIERAHIFAALERHDWNQVRSAEALGIHRNTLRNKIQEYGLKRDEL